MGVGAYCEVGVLGLIVEVFWILISATVFPTLGMVESETMHAECLA